MHGAPLHFVRTLACAAAIGFGSTAAYGDLVASSPVVVPGTSNPWLAAGMPAGFTTLFGDTVAANSPVQVGGLSLGLGGHLTFTSVTGGASHTGGCPSSNCPSPDGSTFFNFSGGAVNGISDVRAPINSLVGVFLGSNHPSLSTAPSTLNFETLGLDMAALSPLLQQVFFIGDGMTSSAVIQQFVIPTGATRLFLGTMDGFGWFNNNGSISATVNQFADVVDPPPNGVPEPASWLLLIGGLSALALRRRRGTQAT